MDWKRVLEAELRRYYHIVAEGQALYLHDWNVMVDVIQVRPEPVCMVLDTDIEVDVDVPLGVEPVWTRGVQEATWTWQGLVDRHVLPVPLFQFEEYVVDMVSEGDCNLYGSTTCMQPSETDHEFLDVGMGSKRIVIHPTREFFLCLEAVPSPCRITVTITNRPRRESVEEQKEVKRVETVVNADSVRCSHCGAVVPQRTIAMHEAFCARHNKKCMMCERVFSIADFALHWHCPTCPFVGTTRDQEKHLSVWHRRVVCSCGLELELRHVMEHKRECVDRRIECRYCHLLVRSGGKSMNARDLYLGGDLTVHESECGSRTIICARCSKPVRIKDVATHAQLHQLENRYDLCSNQVCSNPQAKNKLSMCATCFQGFWSSTYDPGDQNLARKMVEGYHRQLTVGCGTSFCYNKVKTN
jgi:hypothetical protein